MIKTPRRQSGFALVLVLILVAVASILGISYASSASLHVTGATNLIAADRARYLAESGLEHSLYLLQSDPDCVQASAVAAPLGPFFADDTDDAYTLYAADGAGTEDLYTIIASGQCGGMKQTASFTVYSPNVYADRIQSYGPAGYWRLGETSGAVAGDTAGAHPGAYVNGAVLGRSGALNGAGNTAAGFDGLNDYIDTGDWDLDDHNGGLTLMVWFKADDLDNVKNATMLAKADGHATTNHLWSLGTKSSGGQLKLQFVLETEENHKTLRASSGALQAGQWVLAVAVYDGEKMILYENGVEVGRENQDGEIETDEDMSVWIGSCPEDDPTKRPWQGDLDEVAVFNKALTPEQVADLYKARLPTPEIVRWND